MVLEMDLDDRLGFPCRALSMVSGMVLETGLLLV